jgi:hypothetical protein
MNSEGYSMNIVLCIPIKIQKTRDCTELYIRVGRFLKKNYFEWVEPCNVFIFM